MKSAPDFYVFEKWLGAPEYAFGRQGQQGLVPGEDKEAYWRIYRELVEAAENAVADHTDSGQLVARPKQYSRERGTRGHRPRDLWVSVCGSTSEPFGSMPQVYAIASHRGLEVGFAASIPESDYFDEDSKIRNRSIVPFINAKLPEPADSLMVQLGEAMTVQGDWHLNTKTRLPPGGSGFDAFTSVSGLFGFLKTQGDVQGGGVVCRVFPISTLDVLDINAEFSATLATFAPLIARCAPTRWDAEIRVNQDTINDLSGQILPFDPANQEDGRKKVLAEVARRQGQGAFRKALLLAYQGRCAVTGTNVDEVLQAAHIMSYLGPRTNNVTNGLLLRADIHTLFDLELIRIHPTSRCLLVSAALMMTEYASLNGVRIAEPTRAALRPSDATLAERYGEHPTDLF